MKLQIKSLYLLCFATGRMVKDAESLGADAIVGMRYASASVMQGAAEVIAYGTAVKFV